MPKFQRTGISKFQVNKDRRVYKYNDRKTIKLQSRMSRKTMDGIYNARHMNNLAYVDLNGVTIPSIRVRNQIYNFAYKEYSKTQKAELLICIYINSTLYNLLKSPRVSLPEGYKLLRKFVRNTYVGKGRHERTIHEMILKDFGANEFASNQINDEWKMEGDEVFWDHALSTLAEAFSLVR